MRPPIRILLAAGLALATAYGASAATRAQPTLGFDGPVTGMAMDGRTLWASVPSDDRILHVDARTGRVIQSIDVHRKNLRALGGGAVATGAGAVWIAAPVQVLDDPAVPDAAGWIGRLDARTQKLTIVPVRDDRPAAVAVGGGAVWAAGARTLWKLSTSSGRIVKSAHFGAFVGAVASTPGAVWLSLPNAGRVLRLDPATLRIRTTIVTGLSSGATPFALGRGRLWVATDKGLVGIDPHTAKVRDRIPLPGATQVTFDGTRLWALAEGGIYVLRARRPVARVTFDVQTFGLLVASQAGDVWFSDEAADNLERVPSGA